MQNLLLTPGPTMVPEEVLKELSVQPIHHRTKQFENILVSMDDKLKKIFGTHNMIMAFPSSGTGMMEAAVANLFNQNDKVLAVSIGVFGDRFKEIAENYKIPTDIIRFKWGRQADPIAVIEELKKKKYAGVLITHNETSTGVLNDIEKLAKAIRECSRDILIVVDAVSSLGGVEMQMDEWDLDVVITASQKALMTPPGLAFASVSGRAWEKIKNNDNIRYYWSFEKARDSFPQTPYTPPVSLIMAQNKALDIIMREGLENVYIKHKKIKSAVKKAVENLGFEIFADDACASDLITAVKVPDGFDTAQFIKNVEKFGVILSGGQKVLKGKIFRISHMGYINKDFLLRGMDAIEQALIVMGYAFEKGAGIKAIQDNL